MYFSYQALDSNGKQRKGQLEAESPRAARARLRDQGLQPLALQPLNEAAAPDRSSSGGVLAGRVLADRRPVKPESSSAVASQGQAVSRPSLSTTTVKRPGRAAELTQISRQLATLVAAGIPLEEALRNLAGQNMAGQQASAPATRGGRKTSAAMAAVLDDLARRLREGESFSQALKAHPGLFGPLFTAMVAVGERSGQLDQVLIRLADYQERSRQISRKVQLALIYPAILVLVSIAVISGLMIFVVPRLVAQFEQRDQVLPLITRIVIEVSEALQQGGFLLPLLPLLCWLLWRVSASTPQRHLRRDQRLLGLPVLGSFWRLNDIARLARTLSITVGSGLPLLEGLQVAGQTLSNQQLKQTLAQATRQVSEGQPLGRSLLESGEFPDMLVQMVASGERSGELAPLLEKAADHQEQALEQGISALLALLEPILILLLGGMVFAIVLSVLLPVMQLNTMTL